MPKDTPPKTSAQEAREVGEALRILREDRDVTQEQAAEAMHVSRTAWQNYENGRSVVLRTDMQERLARAVGARKQDLLDVLRQLQRGGTSHSALALEETGAIFSGPGRQQAIFPLDEGDVILSYPAKLTASGRAQLKAYLTIFLGADL